MGAAAEVVSTRPRQRPLNWRRFRRGSVPYLLLLPVVAVLGAILAYPIYSLVRISLEQYTLFQLRTGGIYIGLRNFGSVLHDAIFWHTLLRTVVFAGVCVSVTIGGGILIALLLVRVSGWMRLLITVGLVLVWSVPPVVAVQIWNWMTNVQNGVLNYLLTDVLHVGNYFQHNWFASPFASLAMCATLIIWGALPFVAITLYAALSQVPHELIESAQIDGARSWRVFKDVTLPVIAPVLYILTTLSILWDFGVFTQVYLLIGQAAVVPANYVMGVYLWEQAYVSSDYGRGAAISILMLAIVALMSVVYVRKMLRVGEVT
jgi:N,N'-diacetylchitobiose transport system permease protein